MTPTFEHHDVSVLSDGTVELRVAERLFDPPSYAFRIFRAEPSTEVGGIFLRVDRSEVVTNYAGNIGYEIAPAFRGHRYAARACALLAPLARAHGFRELWLMVRPDNLASIRTVEIVGGEYVDSVEVPAGASEPESEAYEIRRYRWRL